jgi:hypothetical protein
MSKELIGFTYLMARAALTLLAKGAHIGNLLWPGSATCFVTQTGADLDAPIKSSICECPVIISLQAYTIVVRASSGMPSCFSKKFVRN